MKQFQAPTIWLLVLALSVSSLATASAYQCAQIFSEKSNLTALNDLQVISLSYEPSIAIEDHWRTMKNKVLIEVFAPGAKLPQKQILTPFIDEATGILAPYAKNLVHDAGLEAIYRNYGDRVDSTIVKTVIRTEATLPLDRQSTVMAKSRLDPKTAVGFLRVFDGSVYKTGNKSMSNGALPLERILKEMGKSTSIVREKLLEGADVFEIGKYFISELLDANLASAVKHEMCLWLLKYLERGGVDKLSNSFYFAHVASDVHKVAYRRFFDFKEVASEKSTGLAESEYVLMISGTQLRAKLLKILAQTEK